MKITLALVNIKADDMKRFNSKNDNPVIFRTFPAKNV